MPNIELSEKEAAILAEELESCLEDLKTERVRTEKRDMHAEFMERENVLSGVLTRLKSHK